MGELISAAGAASCTFRGAFAHLWTTPLHWRARDIAVMMSEMSASNVFRGVCQSICRVCVCVCWGGYLWSYVPSRPMSLSNPCPFPIPPTPGVQATGLLSCLLNIYRILLLHANFYEKKEKIWSLP